LEHAFKDKVGEENPDGLGETAIFEGATKLEEGDLPIGLKRSSKSTTRVYKNKTGYVKSLLYMLVWYSLCNFQYRQHYEKTCIMAPL
jgi:hypothetical protein